MVTVRAWMAKLLKDESGGEMAERVLMGGLILIALVSVVAILVKKLSAEWMILQKSNM
jgi:Flp pilus assembly pilin Flp